MEDRINESSAQRPIAGRLARWGPAVASAGLALAVYAVSLWGTYVYDDVIIAREDKRLHDPALWGQFWTGAYFEGALDNLYRPLVSTSFAVQWWLHGDKPWAMHAVNWVMHAAVSALVAELARRLAGARAAGATLAAYVAGLLFAAHPVHVEAVANLVGRAELMCALGVLAAVALVARPPLTTGRAVGAYLCYVFALLSKEQGMLTPLLMAMAAAAVRLGDRRDVPPKDPDPRRRERARQTALLLAFFVCATAAAYIVYRESILRFWWDRSKLDWTMNPIVRSTGADRWLVPIALVGRCAVLLVAPAKLSFDYGTAISPVAHGSDPYLWLGFAAIGLWLVLFAIAVARRDWPAGFCLVAFAVLYGMVSNFLSLIGTVFAERTLYLPSAFFVMLLGLYAARLRAPAARRTAAGGLVILLALGSIRTVTYALRWNDPLGFYEAALRDRPDSHQIHLVLANERRVRGDLDGAAKLLERTRATWPESDQAWIYSASVELDRGNLDAAEAYAQRAFTLQNTMQAFGILTEVAQRRAATQPTSRPATAPSVK